MKYSIITPSFNQGKFLAHTIESVLQQEGKFFIEYIVVDGASTDNSVEIISDYDRKLKSGLVEIKCSGVSYKWISEPDNGQAEAIEKGFKMASGDVFCWLNSDDRLTEQALEKVSQVMQGDPEVGGVVGNSVFVDEHGRKVGPYPNQLKPLAQMSKFWLGWPVPQPSTFFRERVYRNSGGINTSLEYVLDMELFLRMYEMARFVSLNEVLSEYRLHGDAKTGDWKQKRYLFWREGRECTKKYWGNRLTLGFWRNALACNFALWRARLDYKE